MTTLEPEMFLIIWDIFEKLQKKRTQKELTVEGGIEKSANQRIGDQPLLLWLPVTNIENPASSIDSRLNDA